MKLTTTDFEFTLNKTEKAGDSEYSYYTFYDAQVFKSIFLDDIELVAFYATGETYDHDLPEYPSNLLELSARHGTSAVLLKIATLDAEDFDNPNYISRFLTRIISLCPAIDSIDKLKKIYDIIVTNAPKLSDFIDGFDVELQKRQAEEFITEIQREPIIWNYQQIKKYPYKIDLQRKTINVKILNDWHCVHAFNSQKPHKFFLS